MSVGPFWRYYGGKWLAAPRYPAPSYGLIVEPFAGAAGYACRYPDRDVLLIDADPIIAGLWAWLIGATPADVLDIPNVPEGGTVDDIDVPQPARWLVGFWLSQGSAQPKKRPTAWARNPDVGGQGWGGWGATSRSRVAAWVPRIKHWRVHHGSYTDAPDVPATWFVDPPYQTKAGRHYRHSDVDHAALGRWCRQRLGQVIACDQEGADWLPWTGRITTRSARAADRVSREVVYHRNSADLFGGNP